MTAVIQVLLDSNAEPVGEPQGLVGSPWAGLRTHVRALQQQARVRLRARTSRMGIDPETADPVVDAVDQQIEVAAARVEKVDVETRVVAGQEESTEARTAEDVRHIEKESRTRSAEELQGRRPAENIGMRRTDNED